MVNSISSSGPVVPDLAPKAPAAPAQAAPAHTPLPALGQSGKAPVEAKAQPEAQPIKVPSVAPQLSSAAPPLVPNLTSLALYRDSESGLQVAVVRDRVSGQVVEQFPTERARRLVVLVKQQEAVAQELQGTGAGVPRIDIKT